MTPRDDETPTPQEVEKHARKHPVMVWGDRRPKTGGVWMRWCASGWMELVTLRCVDGVVMEAAQDTSESRPVRVGYEKWAPLTKRGNQIKRSTP
jgi:hypothetical protein